MFDGLHSSVVTPKPMVARWHAPPPSIIKPATALELLYWLLFHANYRPNWNSSNALFWPSHRLPSICTSLSDWHFSEWNAMWRISKVFWCEASESWEVQLPNRANRNRTHFRSLMCRGYGAFFRLIYLVTTVIYISLIKTQFDFSISQSVPDSSL